MATEPLDSLSQQMLDRWRRRREAAPAEPAVSGTATDRGIRLMILQAVVPEDAQYGPHLLATAVRFEGLPPTAQPAGGVAVRCYPVPGRLTSEYQAGEVVKVFCAAGTNLAEKLM